MIETKHLYPTPPAWAKVIMWVYMTLLVIALMTYHRWQHLASVGVLMPACILGNALIVMSSPRPGITKRQMAVTVGLFVLIAVYLAALQWPPFAEEIRLPDSVMAIGFVIVLWYVWPRRR